MSRAEEVMELLMEHPLPERLRSLEFYNVKATRSRGLSMPQLRSLAKEIGKDQSAAEELWRSDLHEAKLLAVLLAEPGKMRLEIADQWVNDLYSWDVCDQLCSNVLNRIEEAWDLPFRYAPSEKEYVRRAGLVMVVTLRQRFKKREDEEFEVFFPLFKKYAGDSRNFVKKAVSWAMREIAKKSVKHAPVMAIMAREFIQSKEKSAQWIGKDVLREMEAKALIYE